MRISDWSSDVCSSDLGEVGRIEHQRVAEPRAPARSQLPILALDVVHDGASGPGEQRRHDKADALARTGRCEGHDLLSADLAKISRFVTAAHAARLARLEGRTGGNVSAGTCAYQVLQLTKTTKP